VRLEVSSTHIYSVRIDYDVVKDLSSVTGSVVANVEGPADQITLMVSLGDEEVFRTSQEAINGTNTVSFDIGVSIFVLPRSILTFIDHPLLWYPYGYGEQSLYQFTLQAIFQGTTCDTWRKKTGFRKSELIQKADQHGESF
jgi:beta-mannosidase